MNAGWTQKRIADVCDVFTDGDWIESKDQSDEGIRLIQTGNVGEGRFKDRSDKARYIATDTFLRLKCTEIFRGDCIISRLPDPVGRSCVLPDTDERMITAVDCTIVRFKPSEVIPQFFVYYTQSTDYLKAADRACSGATRQRISRMNLGSIAIPVPPLAEQKRIVAILDQAFEAIDTAKANAEKNRLNAEQVFASYLASVFLQDAAREPDTAGVTDEPASLKAKPTLHGHVDAELDRLNAGKITKTGGRDASTRHIPGELSLSVGMPNTGAKKGWHWSRLSDLARLESGHTPSRKHPEYWGGTVPWIGIQDARENHGQRITRTTEYTNDLGIANSSARVLPKNTVCLSRTASVGYVVVMGRPMATSQDFVNWICSESLVPDFLKYLILAEGRDGLLRYASGSVHQTIYFPEAKAFWICHPNADQQMHIIARCDELRDESKKLEEVYARKLAELDQLRAALLNHAFIGRL